MMDEIEEGLRAEFESVPLMERTAGSLLLADLQGKEAEATRVAVLSDLLAKDLSTCDAHRLSALIAAATIGWLGDIPRAQIALVGAGYTGPAEALSAAAIDAAAGLVFWCATPERAEQWRKHVDVERAGYYTRPQLSELATRTVASYGTRAPKRMVDPQELAQEWKGWYTDFSMPKHANPLTLKETRTRRVQGGTSVLNGPAYCLEDAVRGGRAINASVTMFYAASLAAFDLLGLSPREPFLDEFAKLLGVEPK